MTADSWCAKMRLKYCPPRSGRNETQGFALCIGLPDPGGVREIFYVRR